MSKSRHMLRFSLIALSVLILAQAGSYLVNSRIPLGSSVEWSTFIHFTHIRNMGGVFGMFQGHGWIFGVFSLMLVSALVVYLWRGRSIEPHEYICFGFVVGGGASNVLDRLIYGSVVDFINVQHIPFWHYIFNTADVMVHVGLWPLLYFSLFPGKSGSTES